MPIIDLRLILLAEQMGQMATRSRNDGVELVFEPNSSVIENSDGTLSPVFDTKQRKKLPIPGAIYLRGPRLYAQVADAPGKLVLQGVWDSRHKQAKILLLRTRMGYNSDSWGIDEALTLESPYEAIRNLTAGASTETVLEINSRRYRSVSERLLNRGVRAINDWRTIERHMQPPQLVRSNFLLE